MSNNVTAVDRYKYANYLRKAEQFARAMVRALENREWDACVANAVHGAISAADALCIITKGVRHRGERHYDAVELFRNTDPDDGRIKKNTQRLGELLSMKTDAEYGERLMTEKQANMAVKIAQRLLDFVNEKITAMK